MDLDYYNRLKDNMNEQILIFDKVLEENRNLQKAIIDREWTGVNRCIDSLNSFSVIIHDLDSHRVELLLGIVKSIHSEDSETLFSLISKAPKEYKDELIQIFYKLKTSVIQVQGVFKGLNNFVEHKKEVSKEIIDILVRDAKGNVYSKPGRRDNDGQGFIVDRQL